MNIVDKISRDTKLVTDSVKDTVVSNVVTSREDLSLTEEQLQKLVTVISLSVDQGYQRALPFFQNSIKKHF